MDRPYRFGKLYSALIAISALEPFSAAWAWRDSYAKAGACAVLGALVLICSFGIFCKRAYSLSIVGLSLLVCLWDFALDAVHHFRPPSEMYLDVTVVGGPRGGFWYDVVALAAFSLVALYFFKRRKEFTWHGRRLRW